MSVGTKYRESVIAGVCFSQTPVTIAGDFAAVRIGGMTVIARCPLGES